MYYVCRSVITFEDEKTSALDAPPPPPPVPLHSVNTSIHFSKTSKKNASAVSAVAQTNSKAIKQHSKRNRNTNNPPLAAGPVLGASHAQFAALLGSTLCFRSGPAPFNDPLQVQALFRSLDTDGSGYLEFGEACRFLSVAMRGTLEERASQCFRSLDLRRAGVLGAHELLQLTKWMQTSLATRRQLLGLSPWQPEAPRPIPAPKPLPSSLHLSERPVKRCCQSRDAFLRQVESFDSARDAWLLFREREAAHAGRLAELRYAHRLHFLI
jgi:hypothetical protein